MKKNIDAPVVEIVKFQAKDVITTSVIEGNVDPDGSEGFAPGTEVKFKGISTGAGFSAEW